MLDSELSAKANRNVLRNMHVNSCVVCDEDIRSMCFKGDQICSEDCRKVLANATNKS